MAGWLASESRDYILHPIFYNRDISGVGESQHQHGAFDMTDGIQPIFFIYGRTASSPTCFQALGDPSEHRAKVAGTTGIARVWSPTSDPSILDMYV